ncbi:XK-related protein 5 [Carettochelys insculpta]|uniref:XK-related protein 5 n=1 Tax=Carettochelys insculpta TaxID=44489 RepID=UPI003EB879F4
MKVVSALNALILHRVICIKNLDVDVAGFTAMRYPNCFRTLDWTHILIHTPDHSAPPPCLWSSGQLAGSQEDQQRRREARLSVIETGGQALRGARWPFKGWEERGREAPLCRAAPCTGRGRMRVVFAGLWFLLLAAERSARVSAIIHYLLSGQYLWGWLTIALLLPDYVVQFLSFSWFRADGHRSCGWLVIVHLLQLGIWKRHWDALWTEVKAGRSCTAGDLLMQQGDLSVLQLLEGLLQTLPHLLMQSYVFVAVEPTGLVPGVSAGLSLLSLSWSLVAYSRFTCLMKPGHLSMPAAALLCQLLWRTGMLGTRVMALVLFARVYPVWVFVAAGAHWLVMSFWLVSQQTDIISHSCHWRLFNFLVGAVYIFCYINFQAGPSKYRVAVFYVITLIENIFLLVLATDILQGTPWDSLFIAAPAMAGFVIGSVAVVVYYSLLHPKSTEIWQSFLKKSCSFSVAEDSRVEGSTLRSVSEAGESFGITRQGDVASFSAEVSKVVHAGCASRAHCEASLGALEGHTSVKDTWVSHHHWLLVKLALKTGDVSKINAAFGDGGIGELCPAGWVESKPCGAMLGPWPKLGLSSVRKCPEMPTAGAVGQRSQTEEYGSGQSLSGKETTYVTLASSEPNVCSARIAPTVQEEHRPTAKASHHRDSRREHKAQADPAAGTLAPRTPESSANGPSDLGALLEHREGTAQRHESPTLYFSANAEDAAPLSGGGVAASCVTDELVENSRDRLVPDSTVGKGEGFPVTVANISPILGIDSQGCLQRRPSLCCTSQCSVLSSSEETSELAEQVRGWRTQCNRWDVASVGTWVAAVERRLRPAEEPCCTSTPKADPLRQDCKLREAKESMKSREWVEQL